MDQFLVQVAQGLQAGAGLALPASFLWGMVSVLLSPCHIASIPLLIAYVAGQGEIPSPRLAARYALVFVCGLFITIVAIGITCALIGRMLGDIGPYWQVAVGILLLWTALSLLLPPQCSSTNGLLQHMQVRGVKGALLLGLAYGFLSGICTFGFIAPILGFIAIQDMMLQGVFMLILFALGHCLPLAGAGMFSARLMGLLYGSSWQQGILWTRRGAALVIAGLGLYFSLSPFVSF
jgi:cytochrome c-type biogenesis protein